MGKLIEGLAERVERLGKRKFSSDRPIASVLKQHEPGGLTGYDWSDREAFAQAIELVKLVPEIVTALRSQSTPDILRSEK